MSVAYCQTILHAAYVCSLAAFLCAMFFVGAFSLVFHHWLLCDNTVTLFLIINVYCLIFLSAAVLRGRISWDFFLAACFYVFLLGRLQYLP